MNDSKKQSTIFVLAVLYIAYIGIGLPMSLLGAAWPSMYNYVGVPQSYAGGISFAASLGMAIASFFSERILLRLGSFKSGAVPFIFITCTLVGFSIFRPFPMLCLMGTIMGMCIGLNESSLNGIIVRSFKAIHMNWMHCLWGLGSAIGPLIMAWTIGKHSSWKLGYGVSAGIVFLVFAIFVLSLPFWKKSGLFIHEKDGSALVKSKKLTEIFRIPGSKSIVLSVFFYCSLEMTVILWVSSYLVFFKNIDKATAAGWFSLFYIGITVGRFVSGLISMKVSSRMLTRFGQAVILVGAVILLTTETRILLAPCIFVIGLGAAPIFPTLVHSTTEHFEDEFAQAIVGMELTAAFLGNAIIPLVFGGLAALWGYGIFPVALLITLTLFVVMSESLNRATLK